MEGQSIRTLSLELSWKRHLQRRLKDGTKIDVTAPIVVKDYNGHMGGIDKA
ncbi:hypothetical protein AVEN_55084-1, partial [Araneus ventricosus]